jgi:excisionase family DNA binding protein
LLTTEDVAEFFRLDVVTVRRMIGKGELTAYRVGGEYRFTRSDIEDYLDRQRIPAKAEGDGHLGKLARRVRKLVPAGPLPDTFERLTKRGEAALALAQDEARSLNHNYIGTEHLLLGVLREGEGVGAKLLNEAGCDLPRMHQAVRDLVGRSPLSENVRGEICLTPRLKKVLQLATEEARRLDHSHVGTEHLVLGLLAEGEGVAGRLLKDVGMELTAARTRVLDILTRQDTR